MMCWCEIEWKGITRLSKNRTFYICFELPSCLVSCLILKRTHTQISYYLSHIYFPEGTLVVSVIRKKEKLGISLFINFRALKIVYSTYSLLFEHFNACDSFTDQHLNSVIVEFDFRESINNFFPDSPNQLNTKMT